MLPVLADYFMSETFGFLLKEPLAFLPEYFLQWNQFASNMAELVAANTMRQSVEELPLFEWQRLDGHRQKRLAHFQLTVIASGYVWQNGDKGAMKSLPASVAVPLYRLSEDLGLPPVVNHAGLVLSNYRLADPDKSFDLENLKVLYYLPGGDESEWFCTVTVMLEFTFAKAIKFILSTLKAMEADDLQTIASNLREITQVVYEMKTVLSRMHEKLTSDTFFNVLRPFLGGWGEDDNPLPDGLIYEGISAQPIKAVGGSAAQSGTMQVLDAFVGVKHSQEKTEFLLEMRNYMLPVHRNFITEIENQGERLMNLVKSSQDADLHQEYNTLLTAMVKFRSYHIQIVTKYIVQASSKVKQSEEKRFESLDQKGTGGTSVLPFLKELRTDTEMTKYQS